MDASLQTLVGRLDHLSDQFSELRDGVQQVIKIADFSPEMALTRARKVLEYVVRDVYERRISEPPGTRPLENLLQRLVKDGFFPDRLDAYATTIRKLGNVGTHSFGEKVAVTDVYQSLTQLMPILEWYFEVERPEALGTSPVQLRQPAPVESPPRETSPAATQLAVVPKGLRSFDAHDADFFLQLLPGPRNRDGLPESIQFWKTRLEETDPDQTFSVGLLYGPSGCGKSSLVKAGLLPRLAKTVIALYVEATADDTETRILRGLRKQLPDLPPELGLAATFTALRRREGRKVVVVLDQFEQWLHAHRAEQQSELVDALRQCDGEHLQAIVMVRDDFGMAATRFMDALDIPILQGRNFATVDLFDIDHARQVLIRFGQAFGKLPAAPGELSEGEQAFLSSVAAGLAQDGKVVSVRLSLFAEMIKGKPWLPATLAEVGGTEGIGVNFLDETFSARSANPQHRRHQQAARAVLKTLLPESGANIKGHMRSEAELFADSGYESNPHDFQELLRVLDGELRLITPTEAANVEAASSRFEMRQDAASTGEGYYQLTHDYLVPSLREWLTRKQKETRRGRAELLLADRSAVWNARPENQQLPSLGQWCGIKCLTHRKDWTPPQRKMMKRAGRYYALRSATACCVLAISIITGLAIRDQNLKARDTSGSHFAANVLMEADEKEFLALYQRLKQYADSGRPWLNEELDKQATSGADDPEKNLLFKRQANAAVGLLRLNAPEKVWPLLKHSSDPTLRTQIIHRLAPGEIDPAVVIRRLAKEPDASIRRALILSLGEVSESQLTPIEREPLAAELLELYRNETDSGLHGAVEWLLRHWKQDARLSEIDGELRVNESQLQTRTGADPRQWYVNTQGHTMVVIPKPGEFWVGEGETRHKTRIDQNFAIASKEVTGDQFRRFRKAHHYDKEFAPTGDCPVNQASWYDAAAFCNWLNEQEEIPKDQWCYEPNKNGQYAESMMMAPDYLKRAGYRLPTEAEWEYACRAGSETQYSFGESEELLAKYAWFDGNSSSKSHPVGALKPNDLGLFDMHGNIREWCQDLYENGPQEREADATKSIVSNDSRVLRGGSFLYAASNVRSAYRYLDVPSYRSHFTGFRVARTYP